MAMPLNHLRLYHGRGAAAGGGGGSIVVDVSNLFIVSVLVLVAGISAHFGRRPPWALQPAMTTPATRRARLSLAMLVLAAASAGPDNERMNPLLDSLRVLGIIRRRVPRTVVGKKAYVRWWERLRALVVLAGIVVALGIALAAVIGVAVLSAAFLLEQAIA